MGMGVGVGQKREIKVPKGFVPQQPLALLPGLGGHPGLCLSLNEGSIIITHQFCAVVRAFVIPYSKVNNRN